MKRIYLDNAATTPLLPEVITAMTNALSNVFGNPSSIHKEGREARNLIEEARKKVAKSLNASIGEIFFTSGGSESNNTVLYRSVVDLGVTDIVTTNIEHHCILHPLEDIKNQYGVNLHFLNADKSGEISTVELADILENMNPNAKTLVSIMHGNNELGIINDLVSISEICRNTGALFHSDTVQTIGKLSIDLQELDIDFIAGSAHKFHGPKGTGFLYINNNHQIQPFVHGGGQERQMRGGTENIAGVIGLATALELAVKNMEEKSSYITDLKNHMQDQLIQNFSDLSFNGDPKNGMYHVLSVLFPDSPRSELIIPNLDIAGISASGGSACTSGAESESHVLKAINPTELRKTVRFSFSALNTKEEIDHTIQVLKKVITKNIN